MWIYLAIHKIIANKTFTVTDSLISWLFIITFVYLIYIYRYTLFVETFQYNLVYENWSTSYRDTSWIKFMISASFITTSKNSTFLIFYLYFFSLSVSTMMSSIKFITLVLIKTHKISFIIIWNIVREFVSLKNIIVCLNNFFDIVNTVFYLSPSFIYILLYFYLFFLSQQFITCGTMTVCAYRRIMYRVSIF